MNGVVETVGSGWKRNCKRRDAGKQLRIADWSKAVNPQSPIRN